VVFGITTDLGEMDSQPIYIFSYGSNTLLQRIAERVESAEVVDQYQLRGFRIIFNKQSMDGSTKANLEETADQNDSVWGVIHRISLIDKPILDRYEGLGKGYLQMTFNLPVKGAYQSVHAYVATEFHYLVAGDPYDWYLNYVIEGAIENGFPEDYIKKLKTIASKTDMDVERRQENESTLKRSRV
jgi:gamma-glutamylcyclotransferase